MNICEAIKSIDFFNNLTPEQILILKDISNIKHYNKNAIIHYENDTEHSLQFLISGTIKVYKIDKYNHEIFLYYIYKNNIISEFASLDEESIYCYSNTEFTQDGKILSINFKKFQKIFIDTGILVKPFIKEIMNTTHKLQCILNRELVFDATSKVSFMLSNDLEIFNSIKRTEVAFMLHLQPETLSRVLKKLIRMNVIEINNNIIYIINQNELSSIFKR